MADSQSLRVMCIFEAGAAMRYSSELSCLAAHIYHRFFRIHELTGSYDLYMFAAASLKLAHQFYEKRFEPKDFCLVMADILHGQEMFLDDKVLTKLNHSIDLAAKTICTSLSYQINYKDTRKTTPGQLQEQYREQMAAQLAGIKRAPIIELESSDGESSSDDDDEGGLTKADRLLSKNDRYLVSSHRYLLHYLKILKPLVAGDEAMEYFVKISNVAWTFMCDFYWSPCVTQTHSSHLACACLMVAIEVYRPILEKGRDSERLALLKMLNRKWNLIFCDDFNDNHLKRAIDLIIEQYNEYDRVLQHELSTFVIDPSRK